MLLIKRMTLMTLAFLSFAGTALASTESACGGSANNPCACFERYVCDDGNCSCRRDKYCADTNCQSESSSPQSVVKEELIRSECVASTVTTELFNGTDTLTH